MEITAPSSNVNFTNEDEPECANEKQKDAKNEVAYDVTNYLNVYNVFECGKTILTCHVKEYA